MRGEESSGEGLRILITSIEQGEVANIIRGLLEVKGERIAFRAIAFGRWGGQNVTVRMGPRARRRVKELLPQINVQEVVQRKLVEGDFLLEVRGAGGAGEEA